MVFYSEKSSVVMGVVIVFVHTVIVDVVVVVY